MICGGREFDSNAWACFDPVQRSRRCALTCAKQQEAVDFGNHKVGSQHGRLTVDGFTKQSLGFDVMLVPGGKECNPGAAIDERGAARLYCFLSVGRSLFRQRKSP